MSASNPTVQPGRASHGAAAIVVAACARSRAGTRTCWCAARTACSTSRCGRSSTSCCSASLAAFVGDSDRRAPRTGGRATCSPGIVLWHVIYQSQIALSTGFLEETWTRNLLNMMVTPVREVEYVAGVALFGMVKLAIGVGVMVLGAFVFFSFDTWTLGFGLVPIAIASARSSAGPISLFVIGLVLRFGRARRRWRGA